MSTFVDSSAFYAALDRDDPWHSRVIETWDGLAAEREHFVTSNYVVVESWALIQRRFGLQPVQRWRLDVLPCVDVEWVDRATHEVGTEIWLATARCDLSLVDCVSFALMRRLGISRALTVDRHFADQGFECMPDPGLYPS